MLHCPRPELTRLGDCLAVDSLADESWKTPNAPDLQDPHEPFGIRVEVVHVRRDGFELNAERDAHLRDKRREVRREVVAVEGARVDAASQLRDAHEVAHELHEALRRVVDEVVDDEVARLGTDGDHEVSVRSPARADSSVTAVDHPLLTRKCVDEPLSRDAGRLVMPRRVVSALETLVARREVPSVAGLAVVSSSTNDHLLENLVVHVVHVVKLGDSSDRIATSGRADGMFRRPS